MIVIDFVCFLGLALPPPVPCRERREGDDVGLRRSRPAALAGILYFVIVRMLFFFVEIF